MIIFPLRASTKVEPSEGGSFPASIITSGLNFRRCQYFITVLTSLAAGQPDKLAEVEISGLPNFLTIKAAILLLEILAPASKLF